MNKNPLQIAIDGPVGAGKGTITIVLAKKLNILHVYTGGMYRALTLACLKKNVDIHNEQKVLEVLKRTSIELKPSKGETEVFLNHKEVSDEIFQPEVNNSVSIVSIHPVVRQEMVSYQQKIIKGKSAVIEGRDIATVVCPNADLKIYLTANLRTRAKRRLAQFKNRGIKTNFKEVLRDVRERDKLDSKRKVSPLMRAKDACILDNSKLTIEETAQEIIGKLKEKKLI